MMPCVASRPGFALCALMAALAAALSACGAIGPEASMRSRDRVTTFGANPQFDNERYEMVDLVTLLDPEGRRHRAPYSTQSQPVDLFAKSAFDRDPAADSDDAAAESKEDAKARRALALAEHAFYSYPGDVGPRRNRVQDRLIGASNQRCGAYKVYLNRFDAYQQTGFGWSTTILGGAAAIVGGLKDARTLGGLAGISSGMQAEISQGFLGNLASYVIVPGIELRRKAIYEEIMARRAGADSDYTLQAALADAARYHGACTLAVGLEQAKEAIQTVENPGMRMVAVTMNNVMQARAMQQTMAKAEAGKATPDDYVIRSFRVEGVPMAAAGQAGVRASAGFTAVGTVSPDQILDEVTGTSKAVLDAARGERDVLDALLAGLQQQIDKPDKPALTGKITALAKELAASKAALKEAIDALQKSAAGNSTATSAALACMKKLQDRQDLAAADQRDAARADLAVATAMVGTGYKPWVMDKGQALQDWLTRLEAALKESRYDTLKGRDAAAIDPVKLAGAVKEAITPGGKLLAGLPALDFSARKIDCATATAGGT